MRLLIRLIAFVCVALMLAAQVLADSDPGPRNNYGRDKLGGMKGAIKWEPLLHGDGLDGWRDTLGEQYPDAWKRDGNAIVGHVSGKKYGRLVQGDQSWKSYVLSVRGTLEKGSNLQIAFRVSEDGKSNYFLDFLTGWQSVSITKKEAGKPGVTKLDVVNFPIEYGREYDITIAVRGQSIISYIDGVMVNRLTDDTFSSGGIGFLMWRTTTARFEDPQIRHYH